MFVYISPLSSPLELFLLSEIRSPECATLGGSCQSPEANMRNTAVSSVQGPRAKEKLSTIAAFKVQERKPTTQQRCPNYQGAHCSIKSHGGSSGKNWPRFVLGQVSWGRGNFSPPLSLGGLAVRPQPGKGAPGTVSLTFSATTLCT